MKLMKCLKCNHETSDKSKFCFYCGAPTESDASPAKTVSLTDKNNVFIYTEKTEQGKPEDLPEDMRLELEEALRQVKKRAWFLKKPALSISPWMPRL